MILSKAMDQVEINLKTKETKPTVKKTTKTKTKIKKLRLSQTHQVFMKKIWLDGMRNLASILRREKLPKSTKPKLRTFIV